MTANAHNSNGHRRVLIVVNHPLGGIRTYLLNNLPHIAKSGYVYTLLAPAGEAFTEFKHDVEDWPGVEFVEVPVKNRKHRLWPTVRRTLKTGRFDLIHSQGLRAGTETAFANFFLRLPHIITLHDTRHRTEFQGWRGALKKAAIARTAITASKIIAVSHDCLENHLEFFPSWARHTDRLTVILNGIDIAALQGAANGAADSVKVRLDGTPFVLGYFGRFMPEKGFTVLLDALRLLAPRGYQSRLRLIATSDPHGYGREYRKIVESDAALREMVKFVPPVPNIGALLPQVDLLVMPSLWEAYGLLAAEAMVLGIPVVGSDAIGLREVLRGTPAQTPEAGNAVALADAIENSCTPSSRHRSADFAAEASRRFDNHNSISKLHKFYYEMTGI